MDAVAVIPKPDVKGFFDPATFTITYVVSDPATKIAAIIFHQSPLISGQI